MRMSFRLQQALQYKPLQAEPDGPALCWLRPVPCSHCSSKQPEGSSSISMPSAQHQLLRNLSAGLRQGLRQLCRLGRVLER